MLFYADRKLRYRGGDGLSFRIAQGELGKGDRCIAAAHRLEHQRDERGSALGGDAGGAWKTVEPDGGFTLIVQNIFRKHYLLPVLSK